MNQPCVVWKASETAPRGSVYERFSQTGRATSHTSSRYNIQAKSQASIAAPLFPSRLAIYTRRRGKPGGCTAWWARHVRTAHSNAAPEDGLTPASRCQLIITALVLARHGASGSAAGWWVVVRAGDRRVGGGGMVGRPVAVGYHHGERSGSGCWRRAYSTVVSERSRPTFR